MSKNIFKEYETKNNYEVTSAFFHNRNKVLTLATSVFDWVNLPPEIDKRYIEQALICYGQLAFFYDEAVEKFVILPFNTAGAFDIYNNPIKIEVFANNGYHRFLNHDECVLIYDNTLRVPLLNDIYYYTNRLTELDKIYNINLENQKTPILISCDESQKLSALNAFLKIDNGQPHIFTMKNFDKDMFSVMNINAPFLCDKLFAEKQNLYSEILSTFGVNSVSFEKKERLITTEVENANAHNNIYRYSRFEPRQQAVEEINSKFNLEISIEENFTTGGEKENEQIYNDD